MRILDGLWLAAFSVALAGCSATTAISAKQDGATVTIAPSADTAVPRSETFKARSFGNHEFRAEAPGYEPFYGILPLKFNGGYLALDILFFAPAAFFNLREVYPMYEFDLEKKYVRYKYKPEEEWSIYVPLESEALESMAVLAPK